MYKHKDQVADVEYPHHACPPAGPVVQVRATPADERQDEADEQVPDAVQQLALLSHMYNKMTNNQYTKRDGGQGHLAGRGVALLVVEPHPPEHRPANGSQQLILVLLAPDLAVHGLAGPRRAGPPGAAPPRGGRRG